MGKVTGYVCYFDVKCSPPVMRIQFTHGNTMVGSIETTDASLFSAIVDMLRNEGPHLYWDDAHRRLMIGLEATGEGED